MPFKMNLANPKFDFTQSSQLGPNEVHLWRIELNEMVLGSERWPDLLSIDERGRASRFLFPRDRQSFTAVRGSLRCILASYLSCDPKDVAFCYSGTGKPGLMPSSSRTGIQFNVSHSGAIALVAVTSSRPVGVDVERLREDVEVDSIARRFFSLHEQEQLAAIDPVQRQEAFFRCWTRKEAYLKATGAGLSLSLGQFDVSLKPGESDCLIATRPDSAEASNWSLTEVRAGKGYVAAVCAAGQGWALLQWLEE